ncbi:hypothetical protein EVG20_g2732 [Dentipellis fragilis]|uniref:Uncharacterized protein n=1 Tax=Dentipellis fragilis TaxID=205917 RepID=A0A4Y9Z806_9AGAM|nr:hypothetical protein EVG20_g2732 [Dentipellis fragilis]
MPPRLIGYTSPDYVKDGVTSAYSTQFNSRNLEQPWYSPISDTLHSLVNPSPFPDKNLKGTMNAREQYNLWIPKEDFDLARLGKLEAEARFPDEVPLRRSARREATAESVPQTDPSGAVQEQLTAFKNFRNAAAQNTAADRDSGGDISIVTAATVPNHTAKNAFPDVVLCHTCSVKTMRPSKKDVCVAWDHRLGQKTSHQCFPIIVEVKRGPSRCLRDNALKASKTKLLLEAESDLIYYMSILFQRDPNASSVIAIPFAGGWWRWVQFDRADIPPPAFFAKPRHISAEAEAIYVLKDGAALRKFATRPTYYLGQTASDKEWARLRQDALLPILEAHATNHSTSGPNADN